MKRFLSVCLIACMLLSALSVVALANASGEPSVDPLAENLIVHYDFEGDTLTDQLADKATGGATKEDLSAPSDPLSVSVIDGVITYTGSEGLNSLFYNYNEDKNPKDPNVDQTTQKGADIRYNTTGEFTFYLDFAVKGDGKSDGGYRDCLTVSDSNSNRIFRTYFRPEVNGKKDLYLQGKHSGFTPVQQVADGSEPALTRLTPDGETFYQYAVTMKYDRENAKWDMTFLLSIDGGQKFRAVQSTTANYAENIMQYVEFISLGNKNVNPKIETEYLFDDFRVYNKVLTADELVGIKHPELVDNSGNNGENNGGNNGENNGENNAENNGTSATEPVTEPVTEPATSGESGTAANNTATPAAAGCASTVSVGIAAVAALATGSLVLLKKKKD